MHWHFDSTANALMVWSAIHDRDFPLPYTVQGDGAEWTASLEGTQIGSGTLAECLEACSELERLAAVKGERD